MLEIPLQKLRKEKIGLVPALLARFCFVNAGQDNPTKESSTMLENNKY